MENAIAAGHSALKTSPLAHHIEVLDQAAALSYEFDPREQSAAIEALQFLQTRELSLIGVKFYRGALVNSSAAQLRDAVAMMRRELGL